MSRLRTCLAPAAAFWLLTACNSPQMLVHQAAQGDPVAQYRYAAIIINETAATPQQKQLAIHWLETATAAGNRNAPALLARCYITGKCTTQNLPAAVKYLKIASNRDNFRAQLLLAHMYANGIGTHPSPAKAIDEIRYAAMNESPQAAELMFLCFYDGFGVPRNRDLALGWLENAAEYGSDDAETILNLAKNPENLHLFEEKINFLRKKLDFFPQNK